MTTLSPLDADRALPRRRFQYSLRSLLGWTAACCVLFALMGAVGWLASVLIVWFLALIAAHVFGNRWHSWSGEDGGGEETGPSQSPGKRVVEVKYAPPTRLRERETLSWWVPIVVGAAAVTCGAGGAAALMSGLLGEVGVVGVMFGGTSAAVIGGWMGLLGSTFFQVAGQALREAAREPNCTRPHVAEAVRITAVAGQDSTATTLADNRNRTHVTWPCCCAVLHPSSQV